MYIPVFLCASTHGGQKEVSDPEWSYSLLRASHHGC